MKRQSNALKSLELFGGVSLLYLLSAAMILVGAAMVIVPVYASEEAFWEKFSLFGTLNLYEGALLLVTLLLCRWKFANSDAISLTFLVAVFVVGSAITLNTVSLHYPDFILYVGIVCLLLAGVKLYVVNRYITGGMDWAVIGALAVLLAWNSLMPGIFGDYMSHSYKKIHDQIPVWLIGWWVTIFAGAGMLLRAVTIERETGPSPFLRASLMHWIFASIILIASFVHQYAMVYCYDIPIRLGDFLPALGISCLLAVALKFLYRRCIDPLDIFLAILPIVISLLVVAARGYALAPQSASFHPGGYLSYPPVFLAIMAVICGGLGWKIDRRLYYVGTAYLAAAILVLGCRPDMPHIWEWVNACLSLGIILTIVACFHRDLGIALASAFFLTIGVSNAPLVQNWLLALEVGSASCFAVLLGTSLLIIAALFRKTAPRYIAIVGAIFFVIGAFYIDANPTATFPIATSCAALVVILGASFAVRDWVPGTASIAPAWTLLQNAMPDNKGWLVIIASFLLLGFGAFASFVKVRQEQCEPDDVEEEEREIVEEAKNMRGSHCYPG